MKKVYTLIAAVLLMAGVFAQSPEKMSYQAVIRNSSDQLVTNTGIGMQISILQGSASGTAVFVETHTTTTNANGLVSIEIGNGTTVSGDFATIDWANGPYFIKTETDPTGGISYSITGTSQLLSVPYTLYAKTAGSITGGITETDPVYTNSEAANITDTDIINLSNLTGVNTGDQDLSAFLTSETDPIYTGSQAANITATDILHLSNLSGVNTGDQDLSAFLTSDPDAVYTGSQAANITATDILHLSNLSGINTGDQDLSALATKTALGDSTALVRSEIPDVSGFISTETDPVFGASAANGITATDITNWNNKQNKLTAGSGIVITGNVIKTTDPVHYIGESFQGGTLFWLDATGQHGLIAGPYTIGGRWHNGTYRYTGSMGDGLYAGEMNTTLIIATQLADNPTLNFAAKMCADYSVNQNGVTYGDWYLPSRFELILLYMHKNAVSGLSNGFYWSSTEANGTSAFMMDFATGNQPSGDKAAGGNVRPIRSF